ncbi:hypothetical protein H0H93_012263 [Arthromyces matolae]|nr:hypothetical protein H0H93_012263 [Arthromyces matolae]
MLRVHRLSLARLASPSRINVPRVHSVRFNSSLPGSSPGPEPFHRAKLAARYTGLLALSTIMGVVVVTTGIFIHDVFTYSEKHVDRVPVSPLALHPELGGSKNLPIARVQVDDEQDEENAKLAEKPKLVIVGGGWGAIGVLKTLHAGDYHVTVVSAETFTTFTPLLPSAVVGTVQVRSLIEPIRKIIARLRGHFVQGRAVDIDMKRRLLEVETKTPDGKVTNIYIPVSEVSKDSVIYTSTEDGKTVKHTIPTNFVLWSTGIAMNPFSKRVTDLLPNQVHKKAIVVDAHLRVKGAPLGEVYAIGDSATVETSVVSHFMDLVDEADKDKNGKIDFEEWKFMVGRIKSRIPMAEDHLVEIRSLFDLYDKDKDNSLSLNELLPLLQDVEKRLTSLPATAQVASQQGKYIGSKLHKLARKAATASINNLPPPQDEEVSKPFRYLHLGSLAYIGNAAVFDLGGYSLMGGLAAMYAWRSVYWNEQVSIRTRGLLMVDWIVRGVWGRDLSRL